jgi:hypothetical protein
VIADLDAAIQVNDKHHDRHDYRLLIRNLRNVLNTRRYHGNTGLIKKLIVCSYGTGNTHTSIRNHWWSTDFVKEFWDDFCPKEFARLKRQAVSINLVIIHTVAIRFVTSSRNKKYALHLSSELCTTYPDSDL